MNSFDAAVTIALVAAVILGFNSGLLRSAVTILAYLLAMPIAIWAMSLVAPVIAQGERPWSQNWPLFFGMFLLAGMVLGKLMRMVIDETVGPGAGVGDRLAGAALGAVRVGLVAVTLVMIFDQLVPADREPNYLKGSRLRPLLSAAGQTGFRSLPPEAAAAIDRLKNSRRILKAAAHRRLLRLAADAASHSQICISAVAGLLSGPPGLATMTGSDYNNHLT